MNGGIDERTPYGFTYREAIEALRFQQGVKATFPSMFDARADETRCRICPAAASRKSWRRGLCDRHYDALLAMREKKARQATVERQRRDGLRSSELRRVAIDHWESVGIPLKCHYCTGPFEHVDHYIPRALGGTDDVTNLVPACAPCNQSKGATPPEEWVSGRRATTQE